MKQLDFIRFEHIPDKKVFVENENKVGDCFDDLGVPLFLALEQREVLDHSCNDLFPRFLQGKLHALVIAGFSVPGNPVEQRSMLLVVPSGYNLPELLSFLGRNTIHITGKTLAPECFVPTGQVLYAQATEQLVR